MTVEQADDILTTIHDHLARYTDAAKLAEHMARSHPAILIPAGEESDLRALYLRHHAAHQEDIDAARHDLQAAEQEAHRG